jgi:glycosyltransferase involved in cell wall biosynthesis
MLDVVGTGDEVNVVRDTVRDLDLDDVVTLHGFLPEGEKSRILSGATLHVSASDAEGWGQVVLEAAAHGVPTVARDVPGLRDSIRRGQTGWLLAEPLSVSNDELVSRLATGIGAGLDQMSDPTQRDRIADSCRAWAAEFSWERMREQARGVVEVALDRAP